MLPPQSNFSWRFVVDLEVASEREFRSKVGNDHALSNDSYSSAKTVIAGKTSSSSKASASTKKNKSKKSSSSMPGMAALIPEQSVSPAYMKKHNFGHGPRTQGTFGRQIRL